MNAYRPPVALLLILAAVAPTPVAAQICLGGPPDDGEFVVGVGATTSAGNRGGFAHGRANLDGPIGLTSTMGVAETEVDGTAWVAGGALAYELPPSRLSTCAAGGFSHSTWTDASNGSGSVLTFPGGVSVGLRSDALGGGAELMPWVHVGGLYSRVKRPRTGTPGGGSRTQSHLGTFMNGGATLQLGGLFLRLGAFVTTLEEPGTTYSLEVGWRWRPQVMAAELRR